MKNWFKKTAPYLMFGTAWVLILAAFLLGERVPKQLSLVLFTLGGVLLGFGAVGIALSRIRMSPEQRKVSERGVRGARRVIQIFVGGLWGVAVSVLVVLHCTFYMINIHRWNKKM